MSPEAMMPLSPAENVSDSRKTSSRGAKQVRCNLFIKGYYSSPKAEESLSCYEALRRYGFEEELTYNPSTNTIYLKTDCNHINNKSKRLHEKDNILEICEGMTVLFELKCWGRNEIINNKLSKKETDSTLIIFNTIKNNILKGTIINKKLINIKISNINKSNISKIYQIFSLADIPRICQEIEKTLHEIKFLQPSG